MKTIILLDVNAIEEAFNDLDIEFDLEGLTGFLSSLHESGETTTLYAYVGVNPKLPHASDKLIDRLLKAGYIVREVQGDNFGMYFVSDRTQAITFDALRCTYENEATNVVLISNSPKLESLVSWLREKDVFVETVFLGSKMDYKLAVKSNGFIDLESLVRGEEDEEEEPDSLEEKQ